MTRCRTCRYAMSRKRKNALMAGFLLFVLPSAVWVDRQLLRPVRQAVRLAIWASDDRKRYHEQTFTVVNVVDGDTLDIDVADGDRPSTRIRLLGVDTPETHHPTTGPMYYGSEATEYARQEAEHKAVMIVLDTLADERDRYGRLLAYVVLPDGEVLNEKLIRGGYGYSDLRFSHSRFDAYIELMEQAIAEQSGLWRAGTREQLPEWLRRRRPDLLRQ